ncbi:MAG TPA: prepilin-type N-terminal cleavage/methylation domain-containing protein [Candidatus Saccharimonadales bacterium]|jgi:prepilin-type N-terminal cleavage/methylation domain-containing protein|nr:prepilin-type N-terminal cleavage/methylation domain-containing protein [Candidatus Saccharimonadales bacterium]
MRRTTAQAFTLVELLIVIALLGVIATIVIAAINPIEQANRANDAGQKADSSQIVSAIQRYYASHNTYPWQVVDAANYSSSGVSFGFITAANVDVGLCGGVVGHTDCTTDGELITSAELQNTFRSRTFISTTSSDGMLYVGKGPGSSSSVFTCWVPKALSNRQTSIANKRVIDLSAGFVNGLPVPTANCDAGPAAPDWTPDAAPAMPKCAECVPE